jgi:hypothetical protein
LQSQVITITSTATHLLYLYIFGFPFYDEDLVESYCHSCSTSRN